MARKRKVERWYPTAEEQVNLSGADREKLRLGKPIYRVVYTGKKKQK